MKTPRETILAALHARLLALPATALRGEVLPERVPAAGILIQRDGEPGKPEVTLSPLRYRYQHHAEIQAVVQGADRTLGGLCDGVEAEAPPCGSAGRGSGQLEGGRDPDGPTLFHGRPAQLIPTIRGEHDGTSQGAQALTALAFETTYGTPPASGFTRMPFTQHEHWQQLRLVGVCHRQQRALGPWRGTHPAGGARLCHKQLRKLRLPH